MKKALFISCFEEWYKNRIEPIAEYMREQDYEVICVVSDYRHIQKVYSNKENLNCKYIHVPAYKNNISISRVVSHILFGRRINFLLKEIQPDVIYLILPPNNTAKYCQKYKERNPGVKLFIDIIDLWPESMPIGKLKKSWPALIWRNWRNNAIEIADYVFTECDLYQEKIRLEHLNISTLYLFKNQALEEKNAIWDIIKEKEESIEKKVIKFAYLGSMNNVIDIDCICRMILSFIKKGYDCELHAIGDGESRFFFENEVRKTRCSAFFYGMVFDETEKIKILAPCDCALNLMKNEIVVGLTIKSIDYLSYALPIINNIKGDTWELIRNYRVGVNYETNNNIDIESILCCNRENIYKVFNEFFNREAFLEIVDNAMRNFL